LTETSHFLYSFVLLGNQKNDIYLYGYCAYNQPQNIQPFWLDSYSMSWRRVLFLKFLLHFIKNSHFMLAGVQENEYKL